MSKLIPRWIKLNKSFSIVSVHNLMKEMENEQCSIKIVTVMVYGSREQKLRKP